MNKLTILSTTDIHAFPTANDENQFGVSALYQLKEKDPDAILLDNGDFFIGSPLATFSSQEQEVSPFVEFANQVGYDVMIPGNHDFDYGLAYLLKQVEALSADYVCCNIFDENDNLLFKPYTIISRKGVKIAVIGAVTSAMPQISEFAKYSSLKFKDAEENIQKTIEQVKNKADLILLAYHGGNEADMQTGKPTQYDTGEDQAYRLMDHLEDLDGLIFGHQHRVNKGKNKDTDTVYVQPGYRGNYIGEFNFTFKDNALLKAEANLIDTKTVEHREIISDDLQSSFEGWMTSDVTSEQFNDYLENNFAYYSIKLHGKTPLAFRDSFSVPYSLSDYILSHDELYELMTTKDVKITNLERNVDGIFPKQEFYRVTTNQQKQFPAYRLVQNHLTNVFDLAFGL